MSVQDDKEQQPAGNGEAMVGTEDWVYKVTLRMNTTENVTYIPKD